MMEPRVSFPAGTMVAGAWGQVASPGHAEGRPVEGDRWPGSV